MKFKTFLLNNLKRFEICRNRRDQLLWKVCASCVFFFSRKQRVFLQNLLSSTRFTLNKCEFTLKLLKFYTPSAIIT